MWWKFYLLFFIFTCCLLTFLAGEIRKIYAAFQATISLVYMIIFSVMNDFFMLSRFHM